MTEVWLISLVAFLAAILTFFSGFGLGTLLLPAFAMFFSLDIAIIGAALVHVSNSLFKWGLMRRHVPWQQLKWFLPAAVLASFVGAQAVRFLPELPLYHIYSRSVSAFDAVVALVLLAMVWQAWRQSETTNYLSWNIPVWVGGVLSGFLGGLTGMQGAVRSAFLHSLSLPKEAFVAAGTLVALSIDLTRIPIYVVRQDLSHTLITLKVPLFAGIAAAILGSYVGRKLLKKTNKHVFTYFVSGLLVLFAITLLLGLHR